MESSPDAIREQLREQRTLTLVCMKGYSDAAVARMLEAEKLFLRGLELRDEAIALFSRANAIAMEFALLQGSAEENPPMQAPDQYEDIDW